MKRIFENAACDSACRVRQTSDGRSKDRPRLALWLVSCVVLSAWCAGRGGPHAAAADSDARSVFIQKQIESAGIVRAIEPGWITMEDAGGRRARLKMQAPESAGMLLGGAQDVVDFPCVCRITSRQLAGTLPVGARVRCVANVQRTGKFCSSVVNSLELQPPEAAGLHWESSVSNRCVVTGSIVRVLPDKLLVNVHEAAAERSNWIRPAAGMFSLPIAPGAVGVLQSENPAWIRPGDRVTRMVAAKLSTGDWAVRSLDVELADLSNRPPAPIRLAPPVVSVPPHQLRSKHLLIQTDLPHAHAKRLLDKLERMCEMLGRHFRTSPKQLIRCVIVHDIDRWDQSAFDTTGWRKISERAGVTVTERMGEQVTSIVYAAAKENIVRHEVVHAFCAQAFGDTGPTRYAEGLAEMGSYWQGDIGAIRCDPIVTDYIRGGARRSIRSVVAEWQGTGDSWRNYAWRWAACELLACNPNYSGRFAEYGRQLMRRDNVSFEEFWGAQSDCAAFEFQQMTANVGVGYNHALAAWDWDAKFHAARPGRPVSIQIMARRGWQPSTLKVVAGRVYDYAGKGQWRVDNYRPAVSADGWPRGEGRLQGAVLTDSMELGAAFQLGQRGAFEAPASGRLYLRCADDWTQLDDNHGELQIHLREAAPRGHHDLAARGAPR